MSTKQTHTGKGDNVAGSKVEIKINFSEGRISEYIDFLNFRAEAINRYLSTYYGAESQEIISYLQEFNRLHEEHILCLQKNNFIQAHLVLSSITELSQRIHKKFSKKSESIPEFAYYSIANTPQMNKKYGSLIEHYLIKDSLFQTSNNTIKNIKPNNKNTENIFNDLVRVMALENNLIPILGNMKNIILEKMKKDTIFRDKIREVEELQIELARMSAKQYNVFTGENKTPRNKQEQFQKTGQQLNFVKNQLISLYLKSKLNDDNNMKSELLNHANIFLSGILGPRKIE